MNVDTLLKSDLLERYLIGQTTTQESLEIENYMNTYPEVKEAYNKLEDNLELVCMANAVEAPVHLLDGILDELDEKPVVTLSGSEKPKKSWFAYGIAASVAALIFACTSLFFYSQNLKLMQENHIIVEEIFDLRSDILNNNLKLEALSDKFAHLNNPEMEKYVLKGDKRAKNLKTVAYINPKEKKSMLDVVSLPVLPDDQVYQIWAELQGKMVSLGVLSEADRRLQEIPYTEDALGLSITIEQKGNSVIKSTETPVAEIELKLND